MQIFFYYSKDCVNRQSAQGTIKEYLWELNSSITKDNFGNYLSVGMIIMVNKNVAFSKNIVNGMEGIVEEIKYETDTKGCQYAVVVYIRVPGAGKVAESLDEDVIPIFPNSTSFR